MRLAVGMEGLMTVSLSNGAPVFEELFCSPAEIGGTEALPDKLHRLTGRMEHVFLVETVVAQLVVHNLVSGEISHPYPTLLSNRSLSLKLRLRRKSKFSAKLISGKHQRGL